VCQCWTSLSSQEQSDGHVQYEKVKDSVLDLSLEVLRLSRKKHSAACQNQAGYEGDIKFQILLMFPKAPV
jgi:hypothetical protein